MGSVLGGNMDKLGWIKDLVLSEQKMEESGMIDMNRGFDAKKILQEKTIDYLQDLKSGFMEVPSAFNEMKGSTLGQIKIYGISNTIADFMLFRNGLKLIFSAKRAGEVIIRFTTVADSYIPSTQQNSQGETVGEDVLNASWGAYGQLVWKYKGHAVNLDYLVRYYMTRFIQESAR